MKEDTTSQVYMPCCVSQGRLSGHSEQTLKASRDLWSPGKEGFDASSGNWWWFAKLPTRARQNANKRLADRQSSCTWVLVWVSYDSNSSLARNLNLDSINVMRLKCKRQIWAIFSEFWYEADSKRKFEHEHDLGSESKFDFDYTADLRSWHKIVVGHFWFWIKMWESTLGDVSTVSSRFSGCQSLCKATFLHLETKEELHHVHGAIAQ